MSKIVPFGAHFDTWLRNPTPATSYFSTWLNPGNPNKQDNRIFFINVCICHWILTIVFLQSKIVLHFDSFNCVDIAHLNHTFGVLSNFR